jgi:SAM-dependent methyltransferase
LDYWCSSSSRSAIGLEASGYGALGQELLGVEIKSKYLEPDTIIQDGPFDCVFSTEVIEHVDNPSQFLSALEKQLQEDGILILTTPNAEYVQQDMPLNVVLAALSPGVHTVLFSGIALEQLLLRSGFKHVVVDIVTERLVAYASHRHFTIRSNPDSEKRDYISYLRKKSGTSTNPDLELGWCYRAAKELVNSGDIQAAAPFLEKYRSITKQFYGLDPFDAEHCVSMLSETKSHDAYSAAAPFSLSCFLFYLGMFLSQGGKTDSSPQPAACLDASAKLSGGLLKLAPQFSQEAATLYWSAFYESGVACLRTGKRLEAIAAFDSILLPRRERSSFGYEELAPKGDELKFRASVQKSVALLQLGKPEEAMTVMREAAASWGRTASPSAKFEAARIWNVACQQARRMFRELGLRKIGARTLARGLFSRSSRALRRLKW